MCFTILYHHALFKFSFSLLVGFSRILKDKFKKTWITLRTSSLFWSLIILVVCVLCISRKVSLLQISVISYCWESTGVNISIHYDVSSSSMTNVKSHYKLLTKYNCWKNKKTTSFDTFNNEERASKWKDSKNFI
jgi:hypothetical protein